MRGFSLLETVVALALFAILLMAIVVLDRELIRFDRSMRLAFLLHPEPTAVLARLRRDVLDSKGYPSSFGSWEQTPTTLLLTKVDEKGDVETVVYDFSKASEARRLTFEGTTQTSEWVAHSVPQFMIDSYDLPTGETAVRLQATMRGELAVDEIMMPRAK